MTYVPHNIQGSQYSHVQSLQITDKNSNRHPIITSETIAEIEKIHERVEKSLNNLYVEDVECDIKISENLFQNTNSSYVSTKKKNISQKKSVDKKTYENINVSSCSDKGRSKGKMGGRESSFNRSYNYAGYDLYNESNRSINSNRVKLGMEKSMNQQIRKKKKELKYDPIYDDIVNKKKNMSKNYIKRYGGTNFGKPTNLTTSERVYFDESVVEGDSCLRNKCGCYRKNKGKNDCKKSSWKEKQYNKDNGKISTYRKEKENCDDFDVYLDDLELIKKEKNNCETLRKLKLLRQQLEKIRTEERNEYALEKYANDIDNEIRSEIQTQTENKNEEQFDAKGHVSNSNSYNLTDTNDNSNSARQNFVGKLQSKMV